MMNVVEELSEKAKAGGSSEMDFDSTSMHLDSTLASMLTFKTSAEGEKSNYPTASPHLLRWILMVD